jgi:hypothetical protein
VTGHWSIQHGFGVLERPHANNLIWAAGPSRYPVTSGARLRLRSPTRLPDQQ